MEALPFLCTVSFMLAVVVVIVGVGYYFSADQRARRAMMSVPRRAMADVIEGERVRVVGQVEARQTVQAPLSGRACVYWRVLVREERGGRNKNVVTLVDEQDGVDFVLRDGPVKALVKTELVTAVLEKDARFFSGFLHDASPHLQAFLAERGHSTEGVLFNKTIRYYEGIVQHGEHVCVAGVGRWERDPEEEARAGAGYREAEMPKRLVLRSPDDAPLMLTDEPFMMR